MKDIIDKIEKIVSATYIATEHIKDNDESKKQLRAAATRALNNVIDILSSQHSATEQVGIIKDINTNVLKILSFINILKSARLLSDRNAELLTMSYMKVRAYVSNIKLSDSMSDIESLSYITLADTPTIVSKHSARNMMVMPKAVDNSNREVRANNSNNEAKSDRQTRIISIIKSKDANGANMSEIMEHMTGLSEKTVQRELQAMIESRLLSRIGEKRWSRYVLPPTLL